MKNTKPRNREARTKSFQSKPCVAIHLRVPRVIYEQMKMLQRDTRVTKEDIFCAGLRTYSNP